jgi:hypothetical protein
MPLPAKILEHTLFICEKVLHEQDGVLSAIRIVDLFYVDTATATDIPPERRAIKMAVVFRVRIADQEEHTVKLSLMRPNGQMASIVETPPTRAESRIPEVAAGINGTAEIAVLAREMGTHYFILYCDGIEVARTIFTLQSRDEAKSEQPQQ